MEIDANATLTYAPIAGLCPDGPLEQAINLILSGVPPFQTDQEDKARQG